MQLVKQQEQDMSYFKTLANIACKGGTTGSMENLMNIMLTAKDLGISPMKAINGGFFIVNGKISMSTALMADRIRKEGHSIRIPEWTKDKCTIIGIRKDNGDSIKFEYTIDDAKDAGLLGSPTWKKYPKQMLYNRAMATLARTLFSDVVGNSYSEDEKWDIMDVPPEKRPMQDPDKTIEMNAKNLSTAMNNFEVLKKLIQQEDMDTEHLESFVEVVAEKRSKSMDEIIESAIHPELFPKFKDAYAKELQSRSPTIEVIA